jgi:hypothetical protein
MSVGAPDYKVPTRNTIKSRIEKTYDEQKAILVRNLEDVDSISLTTDTWTSHANKSYITVVGYFPTQMEFRHNRFESYPLGYLLYVSLASHG